MTRPRSELIAPETTPYYHCINRCVRRAFLCGEDHVSGRSYEHRKAWAQQRLTLLADVFAIDVCAYAMMSNHYHLVLRIDRDTAGQWTETEILDRWARLYHLPVLVERYRKGELTTQAEQQKAQDHIETYRQRLCDISWFMRNFNEHIAREANREDGCTGRFWQGRFTSQALLDEAAVLTCMAYVDLNPIRAGLCERPEESDFTAIQQRVREASGEAPPPTTPVDTQTEIDRPPRLMPLPHNDHAPDPHPNAIGFTLSDYLELTDWCGRAVRDDKRGAIPDGTPPILARLGLEPDAFLARVTTPRELPEIRALGHVDKIRELVTRLPQKFIKGIGETTRLYQSAAP